MNTTTITTIIPTYKRPALLKRAIASCLDQTYSNCKVCIYDNDSQDGTKQIVEEFIKIDPRVEYFCHPKNIGMMGNYQYALSEIKTDFFTILSDDDVLCPWFYEEALKGFKKHPEIAFSATSVAIMSEEGKVIRVPLDLWDKEGYFEKGEASQIMVGKYPIPMGALFHRKVLDAVSIDMENPLVWDCDFLLQIAIKFPVHISKRLTGIFLQHSVSYSNSRSAEAWFEAIHKLIKRLQSNTDIMAETKQNLINAIKQDWRNIVVGGAFQEYFNHRIENANIAMKYISKSCPKSFKSIVLVVILKLSKFKQINRFNYYLLKNLKQLLKKKEYKANERNCENLKTYLK